MSRTTVKAWILRIALLTSFAALLVLVLFSANGYQYDFNSRQIRRTGIIDIGFSDKQAEVYLDGKKLDGHLPFVASNILPGDYDLKVIRPNYWSWEGQVRVEENIIKKIDNIFLYPVDDSGQLIWQDVSLVEDKQYFLSGDYVLVLDKDFLYFQKLLTLNKDLEYKKWSKLVIGAQKVSKLEVIGDRIVLQYEDGKRELRKLDAGIIQGKLLGNNLEFAKDHWVYHQKNMVSFFDLEFQKVTSLFNLPEWHDIAEVKEVSANGNEYLLVRDKSWEDFAAYLVLGDHLKPLAEGVNQLLISKDGAINLMADTNQQVWYLVDGHKTLLRRLSADLELLDLGLGQFKTQNLLLFRVGKSYFLADWQLRQIRQILDGKQIWAVATRNNAIYALYTNSSGQVELSKLDLEL